MKKFTFILIFLLLIHFIIHTPIQDVRNTLNNLGKLDENSIGKFRNYGKFIIFDLLKNLYPKKGKRQCINSLNLFWKSFKQLFWVLLDILKFLFRILIKDSNSDTRNNRLKVKILFKIPYPFIYIIYFANFILNSF